jgi:hypothetical protein
LFLLGLGGTIGLGSRDLGGLRLGIVGSRLELPLGCLSFEGTFGGMFANLWPLDFDDIPNRSETKMKLHILLKHK